MSARVTWRGRPRSDYPWPLRTVEKTVADILADHGKMIGPLPLSAVMEFIYRVKSADYSMSLEYQENDGDPWVAVSRAGTLVTDSGVTEVTVFAAAAYEVANIGFVDGVALKHTVGVTAFLIPINSKSPMTGIDTDIFKDENGKFWTSGFIRLELTDVENFEVRLDAPFTPTDFSLSLVLQSGTYPITVEIGSSAFAIRSPVMTITASEWWPYQTRSGDPAWNTATGAAINGGPAG